MGYRLVSYLQLGVQNSGTIPAAQLVNPDGTDYGSIVYSGFIEVGTSQFIWDYNNYPNDFWGAVKIYPSGSESGSPLTGFSINPQEAEWLDTRVSQTTTGNGSNEVIVTSVDQLDDPIGGTRVEIYPSGQSNIIGLGTTNGSTGRVSFNLDDGTYEFRLIKHGVASWELYYDVVDGDEDFEIQGNRFVIGGDGSGDTVRLYTFINSLGLEPQAGVSMIVSPSGAIDYQNTSLILKQPVTANSDSSGYVYMDVPDDTVPLRVKVPLAGFDKYFILPSGVSSLNVASL